MKKIIFLFLMLANINLNSMYHEIDYNLCSKEEVEKDFIHFKAHLTDVIELCLSIESLIDDNRDRKKMLLDSQNLFKIAESISQLEDKRQFLEKNKYKIKNFKTQTGSLIDIILKRADETIELLDDRETKLRKQGIESWKTRSSEKSPLIKGRYRTRPLKKRGCCNIF